MTQALLFSKKILQPTIGLFLGDAGILFQRYGSFADQFFPVPGEVLKVLGFLFLSYSLPAYHAVAKYLKDK